MKFFAATILLCCVSINANAQFSDILSKVSSAVSGNSTLESITNVITSKLVPTEKQIVGTWVYQEPAVVFESENALTNLGGAAASKKIEQNLQTYLTKFGIAKGKMSFTFNSDKTFFITYGKRKIEGTYTINDNKVTMTFKGRTKPCAVTPQLNNGTLVFAADATKLKDFFLAVTAQSNNTTLTTISSLLKTCKGMQLGIRMTKK